MEQAFYSKNRQRLYQSLPEGSLVLAFSGKAPRKTSDEYYPFFANRNFLYLTGIEQENSILSAIIHKNMTKETLFILPSDPLIERWNGKRLSFQQAYDFSGCKNIDAVDSFHSIIEKCITLEQITSIYLDFDKLTAQEADSEAYKFASYIRERYPYITLHNLQPYLRSQRTIKQPCEIDAMRTAELITKEGILSMMKSSKNGMYEYQYKAEFDYTLANHGVLSPGFPSIISSGKNNFCIHYYSYKGQAHDGDMILNDVGACYDNIVTDVSRGWPCNGKFSDKQKLLYECAYATSNHMFSILQPGIPMKDVDLMARKFNYERLKEIGLCKSYDDIGKYMWHGGAHHVGFDVHDTVSPIESMVTSANMIFCVDIGIYCEEWGIGFRLEDNCLITETGCENLSSVTPRSIEDIEAFMGKR